MQSSQLFYCNWCCFASGKFCTFVRIQSIRDLTSLNVVTLAMKKEKSLVQRCDSHRIHYKTQSNFLQLYDVH